MDIIYEKEVILLTPTHSIVQHLHTHRYRVNQLTACCQAAIVQGFWQTEHCNFAKPDQGLMSTRDSLWPSWSRFTWSKFDIHSWFQSDFGISTKFEAMVIPLRILILYLCIIALSTNHSLFCDIGLYFVLQCSLWLLVWSVHRVGWLLYSCCHVALWKVRLLLSWQNKFCEFLLLVLWHIDERLQWAVGLDCLK